LAGQVLWCLTCPGQSAIEILVAGSHAL